MENAYQDEELPGQFTKEELDRIDTKILNQYYQPTELDLVEEAKADAEAMMD